MARLPGGTIHLICSTARQLAAPSALSAAPLSAQGAGAIWHSARSLASSTTAGPHGAHASPSASASTSHAHAGTSSHSHDTGASSSSSWDQEEYYDDYEGEAGPMSSGEAADAEAAAAQAARDAATERDRALKRVLRSSFAAELAASHFYRGAALALGNRPDAAFFAEQEAGAAEGLRPLLPRHRTRPSLAQGPLSLASLALGAAASLAPRGVGLAIRGAVGDALCEHYNEQLRRLNDAGAAAQAADVRTALRSLRDLPRTPEGAPPAPDLVSVIQEAVASSSGPGPQQQQQAGPGAGAQEGAGPGAGRRRPDTVLAGVAQALRGLGVEGTVGAVVKAGAKVALEAAARV
ncbi:hypothetical protein HYH03_012991 [Edaphochlamys debaryana]|uniref:Ubiquinone biosynthesis protein n=1 Tax=Edaphochlamys debaryana TaxID=47281 RepID=A0A836BTW3_9CHLO|nr:hypothetical protein HYH03_012991 [Edaphochlamys debaryana]|eukprot:KAG2488487.1 hypothetical protein HYH03_012991 [Edaphochlamys debaryana]